MDLRADLRAARRAVAGAPRASGPTSCTPTTPKPGVYGRILGRLAGVPRVVHTTHGLYATPEDRWAKRAAVYGIEAVASRFSHVELVQNPEDLDLMRRLRLAPRRKLRLLGNGVDLERFRPADGGERRAAVRAELGLGRCRRRRRLRRSAGGREGRPGARRGRGAGPVRRSACCSSAPTTRPRPTPSIRRRSPRPRRRGRAHRPPRGQRAHVPRHGRLLPAVAPGGLPARGDGGVGDRRARRGHRHPGVPPGGGRRA